jgi:lysophospholipase L1-like esterase
MRFTPRWLWLVLICLCLRLPAAETLAPKPNTAIIPVPQRAEDGLPPGAIRGFETRHQAYVNQAKQGGIDLLMVGDSITQGWPGPGKAVWDKYYGAMKAAQFGVGYDRTQHVLWRLQNGEGEGFSPKVVELLIGTNNLGPNTPAEAAEGVAAVVQELRHRFPTAKILLLGIFPRGLPTDPVRQSVAAVNQTIAKLDDGHQVFYLDIGAKFLDANGVIAPEIMRDRLHPTEKGYEIWAAATAELLNKLLNLTAATSSIPAATPPQALTNNPLPTIDPIRPNTAIMSINRDGEQHRSFVALAKQGDIDVLFLGDSITDWWRTTGKEVWDKNFGAMKAANFGIAGDTTGNVLWRLQNGEGEGFSPKVILLLIGVNNIGHGNTNNEIVAGVTAIVSELRQRFPSAKILLQGIFPCGDKDSAPRMRVAQINPQLAKLANDKNIFFMDFGAKFLEPDGTLSPEIMPDKLHPTAKGYEIWAAAIKDPLANLLKGLPPVAIELMH